jgi:F-type H+-transporting ATPase subunit b
VSKRFFALTSALALSFVAVDAGSQPMAPPPAGQPGPAAQPGGPGGQPGRVAQPGQPGAQPGQPGAQPGQPGAQPGQPGAQPGEPGRMPQPPGRQPPSRPRAPAAAPQLPPGHVPITPQGAAKPAAAEEHHGGGEHHCAGHGPEDPPPHINYYQGLFGVNNEKSQSPSFVDRLLWRYHNPVDECDPKNQEPPLLGSLINFLVVVMVLVRFGKKPVMEGLAARKKTIMQNIDQATALRKDAEKRLADYKKKLARIEERRAELHQESRAAWETEKARILAEATEKASRLRKDAEFRVSQELKQAESDLMAQAVDGAVLAAEQLIKSRIEDRDQQRLADEFASSLGRVLSAKGAQANPGGAS